MASEERSLEASVLKSQNVRVPKMPHSDGHPERNYFECLCCAFQVRAGGDATHQHYFLHHKSANKVHRVPSALKVVPLPSNSGFTSDKTLGTHRDQWTWRHYTEEILLPPIKHLTLISAPIVHLLHHWMSFFSLLGTRGEM